MLVRKGVYVVVMLAVASSVIGAETDSKPAPAAAKAGVPNGWAYQQVKAP